MNSILIDKIRISGFRGLRDFEMTLSKTTVLTGMNNTGKTSILKSLQLALGSRTFLSTEDLHISKDESINKIIVDIRIVPVNEEGAIQNFDEKWEEYFGAIIKPEDTVSYVPIRTELTYNQLKSSFDLKQTILNEWENSSGGKWQDIISKREKIELTAFPFFYIEAQRDVVEDLKLRTSFLGKMLSDVSKAYNKDDIQALEELIAELNEQTIAKSSILSTIQTTLEGINSTMDKKDSNVSISPFAKKIRDLNKSVSIHYGDKECSFTMDYHGMGTRSWSSLLTFKSFIKHNFELAKQNEDLFFPIIAIEEPEAHLHPNAQKQLYKQMCEMSGQKIISTHSPYIAGSAELNEIRGISKYADIVKCGTIKIQNLDEDDTRKLRQKVINTRGEIFFSKALVLFEGETEEQALPVLAEKYFGRPAYECGIDFIGVGGAGQYFPFILFAESLNIPWYIFSDGEDIPVSYMTDAVKKFHKNPSLDINTLENVFIIDQKEDFEKYIIRQNYLDDIKNYIKSVELPKCVNEKHRESKIREIDAYSSNIILDLSKNHKTKWSLIYAYSIYNSSEPLPPLVSKLFDKIKNDFDHE